jgi:predicted RNA binding protein YcfA (HicA-like mRNA interferase family)
MYETSTGKRLPIPEHPGDLPEGTIKAILKQAGLDMSLSEFKRHL